MTVSTTASISPHRVLKIISIASLASLICGIIIASLIFRAGRLDHTPPFARIYAESELMRGPWRPLSQYAICASIQWLMEIQSRAVMDRIQYFVGMSNFSVRTATELEEQAGRLVQSGNNTQAQQLQRQAEEERHRAREYLAKAQVLGGPDLRRRYVTRFYSLMLVPIAVLFLAVWIAASLMPHSMRATNEIVKISALIGVFHGLLLAILLIFWSMFGSECFVDFYSRANLYQGQWTGRWLFPAIGVVLTGYLFGTIAGWLSKGAEHLRLFILGTSVPLNKD